MPWLPIMIVLVLLLAWLEVDQGLSNAKPPACPPGQSECSPR